MNRRELITRGMAGLMAGYLPSPRLSAEGEETIYVNVQTEFRNNVISDNHCGWIFQGPVGKYKPADSIFAGNQYLYGAGFGPPINFRPLEPTVLELPKSVRVLDKPVQIEFDQTRRNYLHVVERTVGSEIGAGLFI